MRIISAPMMERKSAREPLAPGFDSCRNIIQWENGEFLRDSGSGWRNLFRSFDLKMIEVASDGGVGEDRPRFLDNFLLPIPTGDVGKVKVAHANALSKFRSLTC